MLTVSARSSLPLSRYRCMDEDSLERAVSTYTRMSGAVRLREVTAEGPFLYQMNHLALGPIGLSSTGNTAGLRVKNAGSSDSLLLSIPLGLASAAESTIGSQTWAAESGKAGVLAGPWQDSDVRTRPGYKNLLFAVSHRALVDALTTLTGAESRGLAFQPRFVFAAPQTAPFMQLLSDLIREADEEHPAFDAPGMAERLAEALLFRFLLSQSHTQSGLFSARSQQVEPRHVRRAAEYLDTNFHRTVTMKELGQVTGVTARALQLGFKKYRGCSPLGFVRARRLERARVLLLTSDAGNTVSEVAQLAGIEHLGRFSVSYRRRFGESPKHTLARRWRRT